MLNPPAKAQGELLAAISNRVVAVYADYVGRGPTKVRSYINGSVITCLLEDTLTKPERKLVASGRTETVLEVRATFQETMGPELTSVVEELMGRRVRALVGGIQLEPDIASQVFLLDGAVPDESVLDPNGHLAAPTY
jgi:uncharacterized protein YbcI